MYYACTLITDDSCNIVDIGCYDIDNEEYYACDSLDIFLRTASDNYSSNRDIYYFHNLNFEGDYIVDHLFRAGYASSLDKSLDVGEFGALMSNGGDLYCIRICIGAKGRQKKIITIQSSKTLLTYSADKLADKFDIYVTDKDSTKRNCKLIAECLKKALALGVDKMTIGSSALNDYTDIIGGRKKLRYLFPVPQYDADIRPAHKGGYNYLKKDVAGKIVGKGIILDNNSLYAYVLKNKVMPYGEPLYKRGKPVPLDDYPLFITSLWCSFRLKSGYLPCVQIKHDISYKSNEYLTDSDGIVNLYMTNVDLELFFLHYDIDDISWCGAYYFKGSTGNFTKYIDRWMDIKVDADISGNIGNRTLAKLMLCNIGGKFGVNPLIISRYPAYIDGHVEWLSDGGKVQTPLYLPVAIFMTSYARYIDISAGQANYDRYLYSDTDSLHLRGWDMPDGIKIDANELGAWKIERRYDKAKYLRQKTYIVKDSLTGDIAVTCSGMTESCYKDVTFDNFRAGFKYYNNLKKKRVKGGSIMEKDVFELK